MTSAKHLRPRWLPLAAALVAAGTSMTTHGLEPPRSAVHHHRAQGGRHRPLHVHELRGRARRLRHADRQLPAAAGPVRRPQLLQDGPERAVRDPRRQQRRREGRHQLPVPLPEQAELDRAADRRQERGHPADPGRPGHRPALAGAERHRDLQRRRGARRPPQRRACVGDQRQPAAARCSTSRWTTSAPRRSPTTPATRPSTSTPSTCRAAACRPRCSSASARKPSPSTSARSSTW